FHRAPQFFELGKKSFRQLGAQNFLPGFRRTRISRAPRCRTQKRPRFATRRKFAQRRFERTLRKHPPFRHIEFVPKKPRESCRFSSDGTRIFPTLFRQRRERKEPGHFGAGILLKYGRARVRSYEDRRRVASCQERSSYEPGPRLNA